MRYMLYYIVMLSALVYADSFDPNNECRSYITTNGVATVTYTYVSGGDGALQFCSQYYGASLAAAKADSPYYNPIAGDENIYVLSDNGSYTSSTKYYCKWVTETRVYGDIKTCDEGYILDASCNCIQDIPCVVGDGYDIIDLGEYESFETACSEDFVNNMANDDGAVSGYRNYYYTDVGELGCAPGTCAGRRVYCDAGMTAEGSACVIPHPPYGECVNWLPQPEFQVGYDEFGVPECVKGWRCADEDSPLWNYLYNTYVTCSDSNYTYTPPDANVTDPWAFDCPDSPCEQLTAAANAECESKGGTGTYSCTFFDDDCSYTLDGYCDASNPNGDYNGTESKTGEGNGTIYNADGNVTGGFDFALQLAPITDRQDQANNLLGQLGNKVDTTNNNLGTIAKQLQDLKQGVSGVGDDIKAVGDKLAGKLDDLTKKVDEGLFSDDLDDLNLTDGSEGFGAIEDGVKSTIDSFTTASPFDFEGSGACEYPTNKTLTIMGSSVAIPIGDVFEMFDWDTIRLIVKTGAVVTALIIVLSM